MNTPDLKRLIAAFLAFSVITSVGALISLNFMGKTQPAQDQLQVEGDNPLSTISKNAFVENLPSSMPPGTSRSAAENAANAYRSADVSDSSNLTKNFAGVFASQMIENNPDGPQLDQDGNPTTLNLPGEKTAEEMVKQALSKTTFSFDERVVIPEDKIAKSFGPDDVSNYLTQTQKILGDVSLSVQAAAINQSSTAEDFTNHALAVEAALEKLSSLTVPQPLAELHKEVLGFLANQKNVLYAVTNYQSDPLKTIVAIQNENEIVARDIERVKNAAAKVDAKSLSLNSNPEWQKLYSEIFGIKKAYALFGAGDIVFDPSVFGQTVAVVGTLISNNLARIAEWAYTTALRVAVNLLINEFQNQVVNWIAGGGKPKFITDWNGFLRDIADKAAGEVIYGIAPQLCSGIQPLVIRLFQVPYAYSPIRCTLTQVVNNVNRFFNSFRNGGWYVFSYSLQPNNNFYGSAIIAYDAYIQKTTEAANAAQSQAIASKGFLSVTRCTKYVTDEEGNPTTTCEPGYEVITTPGAVVGETLTQSLGWKPNEIVSAQRFEDLVAAIVNASINRIIKEGLGALTEPSNPPRPSFTNAAPINVPNPASLTATKTSINNFINSLDQTGVFQQNQNIITADTQWLALALSTTTGPQATTSAVIYLNRLSAACGGLGGQTDERINDLKSLSSGVQTELNNAVNLKNLRNSALAATSTQDLSDIVNQLQTSDINAITTTATGAQARLDSLNYFISVVGDKLTNGDCTANLPSVTSTPPTP